MLFIIDPTHPPLKVDMASSVVECPRFSPSEMVTHLAHGNRYERSLRHMLTRNAKFNRIYSVNGGDEAPGFTSTHYTKPLVYGEEPYYCPNGWRRYSIDVGLTDKEFQQKYVSWPVAYHGTSSEAAASIILEGFKAFNYKSCYIKESDTAVYLTPSIKYAGHPRYAKVEKVGKLYMQIALQVRVKRDKFIKEPGTVEETLSSNDCLDSNFKDNNELEWIYLWNEETNIRADDGIVIYGLMARITDTDPKYLPENNWWEESRTRLRWDRYT